MQLKDTCVDENLTRLLPFETKSTFIFNWERDTRLKLFENENLVLLFLIKNV